MCRSEFYVHCYYSNHLPPVPAPPKFLPVPDATHIVLDNPTQDFSNNPLLRYCSASLHRTLAPELPEDLTMHIGRPIDLFEQHYYNPVPGTAVTLPEVKSPLLP